MGLPITDIAPLTSAPISQLDIEGLKSDLAPLAQSQVRHLSCGWTPISDLSPLDGVPLESVHIQGLQGIRLDHFQHAALHTLWASFSSIKHLPRVDARKLKKLFLRLYQSHLP